MDFRHSGSHFGSDQYARQRRLGSRQPLPVMDGKAEPLTRKGLRSSIIHCYPAGELIASVEHSGSPQPHLPEPEDRKIDGTICGFHQSYAYTKLMDTRATTSPSRCDGPRCWTTGLGPYYCSCYDLGLLTTHSLPADTDCNPHYVWAKNLSYCGSNAAFGGSLPL
jgi:hypothetical protein